MAVGLIIVVTSQTGKDQGMGAMGGGQQQGGGSRYKGGYEERLDGLAARLAIGFLVVSVLVTVMSRFTR